MPSYLEASYWALVPSAILVAGGMAALVLEVGLARRRHFANKVAIAAVLLSATAAAWIGQTGADPALNAVAAELATDLLSLAFMPVFYLAALAALVLGGPYLARHGRQRGEFPALVLFSTAGMVVLVQARDLLVLFLALETISIPIYVLAGFLTSHRRSLESALKYFTVGAFSSALLAMGLALAYGATGTLSIAGVGARLAEAAAAGESAPLLLAHGALAFVLAGLGFKVALVPFHAWAPDVYQGAPTPVTAFLAIGSKAAGLAALVRLLVEAFGGLPAWGPALAALAAASLVVGNTVAMLQEDIKRLLAYSGIAHVGFVVMGLAAHQRLVEPGALAGAGLATFDASPALPAIAFYVAAYALMAMGVLAVVTVVEGDYGQATLLLDYAGLARRQPVLAGALLVLLLSAGGLPPLAGFIGKWLVFSAALTAGLTWLAVLAAVMSVIGFYYYLKVVLQAFLRPAREDEATPRPTPGAWWLIGAGAAGCVLLGLFPLLLLRALGTWPVAAAAVGP